jgi:adenylate cyclase
MPATFLKRSPTDCAPQLKRSLLLSSDFAAISGAAVESLGAFALKGVGAKQEIFAPVR